MNERRTNWAAELDAYILGGIGAMLLRKAWGNELVLYIHPRYTPLVVVTGVVLLVLAIAKIWGAHNAPSTVRGRAGVYALLLVPVTLGVLVPASPVGSSLMETQQGTSSGLIYVDSIDPSTTEQWTLMDWMYARYDADPAELDGKPVDVVGFVYQEEGRPADEFTVVRYTVACCVADRRGVYLPVQWTGAADLAPDQWVRVRGTVVATQENGVNDFSVVDAQVEPVEQPETPYLYP